MKSFEGKIKQVLVVRDGGKKELYRKEYYVDAVTGAAVDSKGNKIEELEEWLLNTTKGK